MDIDTKSIQLFLWKVLHFIIEACYNIVQAYPKTSLVTITALFLYVFLPLVLVLLVCSLVASAIGVVVYRVYYRDDLEGFDNIRGYKKTDDKSPIIRENEMGKNVISLGQSETARRRNVNQKDVARSAEKNDDLFDRTAVVQENLKEIREVNVHSGKKKAEPPTRQTSLIVASPPFSAGGHEEGTHFSGGKEDVESSDDSEEEDGHERNKAVEWSFDDQMNLSHVGNIEIERNTRLENLIARRRARKLLDIHVRNTLMRPATNDPRDRIPSIITARKNHFLSSTSELSPIPGSAPSVLLPMHKSPFDISFDPEKEKPISTGDSFEKDILADQHKTLCKHESFGRNSFSPVKSLQGRTNQDFTFHHGPLEKNEYSRTGHQPESSQGNEEDGSEVETKQIVHEKINETSRSSSSSSEEDIPMSGADKDKLLKSLSSLAQKDTDSDRDEEIHVPYNTDRLLYEKTAGNSFFGEKHTLHAPSNSLASDLQVEVSEVGSPHSTSSNDKTNIFDDYINKEVTSGGEHADESHTREVNEVSEKDITDTGVSSTNHNFNSNTSDLRDVNEVSEKDITDAGVSSTNHNLDSNTSDLREVNEVSEKDITDAGVSSTNHNLDSNVSDLREVNELRDRDITDDGVSSTNHNFDSLASDLRDVNEVIEKDNTDVGVSSANHNLDSNTSDLREVNEVSEKDITDAGVSSTNHNLDSNTSDLREVNEVNEKDITDTGVSSTNHNFDSNTSDLQPEKVVRQEEINSHFQPSNLPDSSIQVQTTDVKPDHPTPSDATDAPSEKEVEDSNKRMIAHTSASDNIKEVSPEEVNVVEESVIHNNDVNEGLKSREVIKPEAVAEVSTLNSESFEDTSSTANKHSDLNTSNALDQKNSSVPVTDENDPSATQNMPTQDREEGNLSSHDDKSVTIENEAHTKLESDIDSETDAKASAKHVDLVEPSNSNNSKASQDTDENVGKIVGDENVVDTSKATEEIIKNIASDVKNNELQEAEPHKDKSQQHLEADGNNNTETIKVVESESTSTPNETVVATKQVDPNDDLGKTTGHTEVQEHLNSHQGNSTVEGNIVPNDNETVNSAAEENEIKSASEATRKDDNETVYSAAEEKETKPASVAAKKDDNDTVHSAAEEKKIEPASEATKKDDNEKVNSAAKGKEVKPASAEKKKRSWKFF